MPPGYYYFITGSLFDSKYVGGDGEEYSTRFNSGLRYTPALYDESIAAQMYRPDNSQVFARQFPSSTGVDFTISYRINNAKYTGVWSLMVKNALMQPDYSDPFYDFIIKDVIIDKMKMPIPSPGYKIEF